MHAVSGHHITCLQAHLKGFSRRGVKGESYPAVFSDAKGTVEGVLYLDVPHSAWERLDEYEGEMYSREVVVVTLEDGRRLTAQTYVVKPSFLKYLDTDDWDFDYFLSHNKSRYLGELK